MIDVLVVGGGLAGAATATHLAEAGHDVLVLERSREDGRKACGEGLFPRGVRELDRLGLLDRARALGRPLEGVRFRAGPWSAAATFGDGGALGLGIQRAHLDPLLRERARQAGAVVRRGVAVRSLVLEGAEALGVRTDSGEEIGARVIVGADGLRSRVRKQAGLERRERGQRYGVSAHARLPVPPEPWVEVSFASGLEVYVTPVGGDVVNIAVLLRRREMQRFAGRIAEAFSATLQQDPRLAHAELLDVPLAAGPFPARARRASSGNIVLVGDAAGFFDAISGEGMSATLASARLCAEAVDTYLQSSDPAAFRSYDRARRALVRNSDLLSGVSLALASRPALARHAVRNLGNRPDTFSRLVRVSAGELGLRDLRPRDALALALGM